MILTIWKSKQKKWVAALMTPVAMAVMMYFTFGVYIALEKPLFNPRGMYGLGVLLAILAIQCVELEKKGVVRFVCLMLSWCFISFSFTYGNALKEQDWYLNFRMQLVISDLNSLDGIAENEKKILQLDGTAGYAPIVKRMKEEYPMVPRLVKNSFGDSGWYWDDYYFRHYFKLKNVKKDKTIDLREMDLPIIKDTMYHTIRGKDEYILIEIK